jgi:HPr kinase/phosphorylase
MNQNPSKTVTQHGVFIDVSGVGVLLSGRSGIGKSELALGLINLGHRLIADDSVVFSLCGDKVIGSCPEVLQDFLEVRGLGILNIRAMFGDTAIKDKKTLQLVINIIQVNQEELYLIDRLQGMHDTCQVLNVVIPEVSIPVAPGRNLAILVEGAVRNHLLKSTGYHSSEEFAKRHQTFMQEREK